MQERQLNPFHLCLQCVIICDLSITFLLPPFFQKIISHGLVFIVYVNFYEPAMLLRLYACLIVCACVRTLKFLKISQRNKMSPSLRLQISYQDSKPVPFEEMKLNHRLPVDSLVLIISPQKKKK